MIRSCTCKGGAASTLEPSRKRVAATCQVCGGKQLVDGSGSHSRNMVSTVGLELTSVMNSGLTWKTVSKGNRSASRRARKTIAKSFKESENLVNEDRKRVEDMPVSESEKLGVTVLGRRFSEKIEHVPIKKRRFLFRSPSPPPRTHSPHPEEHERHEKNQSALCQESVPKSIARQQGQDIGTTISCELGQVTKVENASEWKNSKGIHSNHETNLSILAAVACSNSIEGGSAKPEEGSGIDEGSDGTDSCIVAIPLENNTVKLETTYLSPKNLGARESELGEGKDMEVPVSDDSGAILSNLPANKHDETCKVEVPVRDDRSHWDLNVIMDAWENPCNDPNTKAPAKDVCSMECEKQVKAEVHEVCSEPGDTKNAVERSMQRTVGNAISASVHNREMHSLDVTVAEKNTSLHEKLAPLEFDNALNNVLNLERETKTVHNQERISSNEAVVVPALLEHTKEPSAMVNTSAVPNEFSSTPCISYCTSEDGEILSFQEVAKENVCDGHTSITGAGSISGKPLSKECGDEASSFDVGMQIADGSVDAQNGGSICFGGSQVEKHHVSVLDKSIPKKASSSGEEANIISGMLVDGYTSKKVKANDIKHGQAPLDNAISKSDVDASQFSPNSEELFVKDHVVVNDEKVQDCEINIAGIENRGNAELGSSVHMHINSEELSHKSLKGAPHVVDAPISVGCLGSEDASKSSADNHANCSGKVALEEGSLDNSDYESDGSHHAREHLLGVQRASDFQDGYDSQYEDGELREPIGYSWEEDFGDEGDAERVDYGSDNRETHGFDATAEFSDSVPLQGDEGMDRRKERSAEFGYVGSKVEPVEEKVVHEANTRSGLGDLQTKNVVVPGSSKLMTMKIVKQHDDSSVRIDAEKGSNHSIGSRMKLSGWDQLPEGSRAEIRDGGDTRNQTSACPNGFDPKDSMARVGRREIQSRFEGPTTTYLQPRNDRASLQGNRSNNFDDANCRDERDIGSVKSVGRGGSSLPFHGRGRGGDHRGDSSGRHWGPTRHSPSYYSPGFVHSGPKNAALAAAAKLESNGFVVGRCGTIVKAGSVGPRQSVNGSQPVHRSHIRRGSPSDRDEAFSVHMGTGLVGERGPDRGINIVRGRPVAYGPRVAGTGSRERYNGSAADDSIGSLNMMHPLARRERSFSPIQRRGGPHQSRSRTRSRSRSRTRSPRICPSPRGRSGGCGPGFRRCSRSPRNFRYETRMDRIRSPHRRTDFGVVDHMLNFASTPGSRGSPPHTSRWIDERKDAADHFREHGYRQRPERSSPGRVFRRAHRFNLVDPIRLRPDVYYRHMHPGRFSQTIGTGRGTRYDGSDDDRRKHPDKYGMAHPVRRYDADDSVKQFGNDLDDGFTVHHSRNKDASAFHGRGSAKNYVRGIDNRLGDAPRRAREEKDHFRYGRDGKFNANSKSFGMRDCDEEIAPRRRRPS